MASAEAELRTFLIADIRGYTTYTRERGADAAADLVARFAKLVREVVAANDGFVIELRGDEALAVFVLARRALRAALELQTRFATDLDRGVGIGLDAGEAIPIEGGYRGSALNLAARLCGQAGPGETLASEAVIHLAAKVDGIGYADPRVYRLKGLDEPIRAVHVVPAEKGSTKPIRYGRDGGIDRRLLAVGEIAAVAVVLAGVGLSGILRPDAPSASPNPGPASSSAAELVALDDLPATLWIDPNTGQATEVQSTDSVVVWGVYDEQNQAYYVHRTEPNAITEIDAATHQAGKSVSIPLPVFAGIDGDDRTLWIADAARPRVIGIDWATGAQVAEFSDLTGDPDDRSPAIGLVLAAGSLWVGLPDREEVVRLDPASGAVQARITEVRWPDTLITDGDAIYATGFQNLSRIDPVTNRVTWETKLSDNYFPHVTVGNGFIWAVSNDTGVVYKVSPTGQVVESFEVGGGALPMAALDQTMWVGIQDAGKLVGIDMVTGATRAIVVGHLINAVAAGENELLVTVDRTPEEEIAEIEGDVLTIATPFTPFINAAPDPAQNGSFEFRQAGFITCAGLLRYPDKPAPDGWTLEPEVAASMPEVSTDGRTYTFTIREGFAFSPPSNEPVTAETFRYSIERALSPDIDFFAADHLSMMQGASAYRAGIEDSISGLAADGDRLTITLESPTGDFLNRLTEPFFCPVPVGTPALRGLDPSPPLPAPGPYYLARHLGGELGLLLKNPNYTGDRPRPFEAIAFRMGWLPGEAIGRVDAGLADAATSGAYEPIANAQSDLAARWGPDSENASAGDQRWFGASRFQTQYLSLNGTDPLLADPAVREAIALTLDRDRLAAMLGLAPTSGLLPPSVQGSIPMDTPIPPADLDAARALMAGRTGSLTIQGVDPKGFDPANDAFLEEVASQLSTIGITVEIERSEDPFETAGNPNSGLTLIYGFTDTDHPDPVAQLTWLRHFGRLGADDLDELRRLEGLTGQARYDGAAALATKLVEQDHLIVPIGHPVYPLYLGEGVGCGFVQPAIGAVDLLSLCREP